VITFLRVRYRVRSIVAVYFDRGFAKVSVFLVHFIGEEDTPSRCWVIVGDIPPACIDAESNKNGAMALAGYVYEMRRWIDATRTGSSTRTCIPVLNRGSLVPLEPDVSLVEMLEGRLKFIEQNLLTLWEDELELAT